jgi:hypothetical protein
VWNSEEKLEIARVQVSLRQLYREDGIGKDQITQANN